MSIVNAKNAKKYEFGGNCEGYYFLETPGFNVKFEKIPPGSTTSLHYHKEMTQFFFVKSGVLSIETEKNGPITLSAGEGVELSGYDRHRVHNRDKEPVEYLVAEKYADDCGTYYDQPSSQTMPLSNDV